MHIAHTVWHMTFNFSLIWFYFCGDIVYYIIAFLDIICNTVCTSADDDREIPIRISRCEKVLPRIFFSHDVHFKKEAAAPPPLLIISMNGFARCKVQVSTERKYFPLKVNTQQTIYRKRRKSNNLRYHRAIL